MLSPAYRRDPAATTLPWLESPFTPNLLREATHLDAASLALATQYAADGYVVVDLDVPAAATARVIEGLAPLLAPRDAPPPGRIQDAWRLPNHPAAAPVRELALAPRILALLRLLYRREPVPFQTLNFPVGTQQPTHSDTVHFHSVPARYMCGVWVALEDIHADAGPLHYYPGSHRLPIYTLDDLGIAGSLGVGAGAGPRRGYGYAEYERFIAALVAARRLPRRELTVRRGQALIWSANLLHGGSPVRDPARSRHSQVTHYFFADCINYTPMCSDLPLGRIATRAVHDLATGRLAPAAYCGQPVTAAPLSVPRPMAS